VLLLLLEVLRNTVLLNMVLRLELLVVRVWRLHNIRTETTLSKSKVLAGVKHNLSLASIS
jgi:hypothetical protein